MEKGKPIDFFDVLMLLTAAWFVVLVIGWGGYQLSRLIP